MMKTNINRWFENISAKLFMDDGVLLRVMNNLDKCKTRSRKTLGINTQGTRVKLEYNPDWIDKITFEQFEMVVMRELLKVLLKHPTNRLLQPAEICNLASNITINEVGNNTEIDRLIRDVNFNAEAWNLEPKQYLDEYFRKLYDEDENGTSDKVNQMFGAPGEDGEVQHDDPMKEHFDPRGDVASKWGQNELFDEKIRGIIDEATESSKMWGKHSGAMKAEIIAAFEPKVSPRDIIRRFKKTVTSFLRYASRMKLNRRYGLKQPGYRRSMKCKLLFAVDISVSMSDKTLQDAFSIVKSTIPHADISYVTFDTEIKDVTTSLKKAKNEFKITGRGGTDTQCVIDYINNEGKDYSGTIVISDMYWAECERPRNNHPILWICTESQEPPVSWGSRIFMEDAN